MNYIYIYMYCCPDLFATAYSPVVKYGHGHLSLFGDEIGVVSRVNRYDPRADALMTPAEASKFSVEPLRYLDSFHTMIELGNLENGFRTT